MSREFHKPVLTLIVWTMLLGAGRLLAAGDAPPALDLKGARILVCSGYNDLLNLPTVQRLKAAGSEVRGGNLAGLTWETVKPFNLIIAIGQSPPNAEAGQAVAKVLDRFVRAGGGLLFFRQHYYSEKADEYLAPFGASIPWELVQDPTHTYRCPSGFNLVYAYTEQVAPNHPVTEGVKALWYSAGSEILLHTSPLKVSAEWQTLVTGEKEASAIWVGGLHEEHLKKPGAFASAPPLIAAREVGAGAIVLIGINPMEMFYGQGLPAYQDIVLEKGDGLRPSGLGRLYANALRWLAAHAVKSQELGQGALQPAENSWAQAEVHDWNTDAFGNGLCTNPARGVIGAHSTFSDGKAAPEALIEKAKALGLQWLAFTERLEEFSPEKWEQLRKICKSASTPQFAALPGLDYQDNAGARFVAFGDFAWPPEKVFSADKQRIVQPQWWFNINCAPNGPYDLAHSPLRHWDLSMYDFLPVRSTLYGTRIDEDPEAFRHTQGIADDPFPMAVEMVADETQLAAAAGRMCNFITQDAPGDLTKFFMDHCYLASSRGFASDGPLVTDWRAVNGTRISGGKWWLAGTEQYRVRLSVHSRSAITEVCIYDGPRLFRRFCPRQDKVSLTLELPHDQQRNLTAEIVDADGKRAVTGSIQIRDWLNFRFMCSDRGNSITDGVFTDEAGPYLSGPTASYQRKMTPWGVMAGYSDRSFNTLPPDFDGGMRPVPCQATPNFAATGYTLAPPKTTLETRMEVPVCSRDGLLQDETLVGYFAGTTNSWSPKLAPQDIQGVRVRVRNLAITARPHDAGANLVEGALTFDRPLQINSLTVFTIWATSAPGYCDHYALSTPETCVTGLAAAEPFNAAGRMAPGSYACVFPSLWGSGGIVALDDGYQAQIWSKAPTNSLSVTLAGLPRNVQAGETISYRYVVVRGRGQELPNTADWDRFCQTMGLRGKPTYEVKDIKAGEVKSTRFLLELLPADNGFVGTVTQADLPIRLPVRVAGMNPNWTFAWFDLGRKQWFPSAVDPLIRQGYFTLDTRLGPHRLFAGHPVLASSPEVRITVCSDGQSTVRAALNNVGDQPLNLTVRLNPALGDAPPQQLALDVGEVKSAVFSMSAK
ncbi:MAG: hypothetical protein ABSE73_08505 [Planctomycetota bacterium]